MVQHGRQILFGLVSAAILVVVIALLSNQVGSSSALQAASTSQALELDASSPTSLPVQGPQAFFARGLSVVSDVNVVGIQITGEKSVRVNLRYSGGSESSPSVTVVLTGHRLSGSVANIQVSKTGTDLNMDLLGDGSLLPAKPVSVLVVRSS
ncbi:MAG: hypothetical protein HYU39_05265 [Thaumarchaeota archaeon]|nr:hypothetical protein [Nitrososphaerota archaeon]